MNCKDGVCEIDFGTEEAITQLDDLIDEHGITFQDANPELYQVLKEALKKRIPKKAINRMLCPCCGVIVSYDFDKKYAFGVRVAYDFQYDYCPSCGQALSWLHENGGDSND